MAEKDDDFRISVTFEKASTEPTGRFVRGWASVVFGEDGSRVKDDQDDHLDMENLTKAAHDFISESRVGKVMHDGEEVGRIVGAIIVDDAFAKAMGITSKKRGLWVDYEITHPDIQKRAAKGEFKGFSIGGKGRRVMREEE